MKNQNGGLSYRCGAAVSSFKYIAFESDTVEAPNWLKFIVKLQIPIAAQLETPRVKISSRAGFVNRFISFFWELNLSAEVSKN